MSSSPLFTAGQRAPRYWFDDGLPTLLARGAYLLMYLFLLYPREGNSPVFATMISVVAVAGYGVLLLRQRQILGLAQIEDHLSADRLGDASAVRRSTIVRGP